MAYEPTQWKAGDVVTSAKLNKMEQGIARYDVVEGTQEGDIITLNKTWQQIWDNNYMSIMITNSENNAKEFASIIYIRGSRQIAGADTSGTPVVYRIVATSAETELIFTCDSPDAYPSYDTKDAG